MRLFGTTIRSAVRTMRGQHLGDEDTRNERKVIGQIIVSVLLVAVSALLLILRISDANEFAYSTIGAVIGYWLK